MKCKNTQIHKYRLALALPSLHVQHNANAQIHKCTNTQLNNYINTQIQVGLADKEHNANADASTGFAFIINAQSCIFFF